MIRGAAMGLKNGRTEAYIKENMLIVNKMDMELSQQEKVTGKVTSIKGCIRTACLTDMGYTIIKMAVGMKENTMKINNKVMVYFSSKMAG